MSSQSSKMCRKICSDWINCSNWSKGCCYWWYCHFWTWGPFSWRCEAVIFKTPCCKVCYLENFILSVDEDFWVLSFHFFIFFLQPILNHMITSCFLNSQSSLTGESMTTEKTADIREDQSTPLLDLRNICFMVGILITVIVLPHTHTHNNRVSWNFPTKKKKKKKIIFRSFPYSLINFM